MVKSSILLANSELLLAKILNYRGTAGTRCGWTTRDVEEEAGRRVTRKIRKHE